VAFVAEKLVGLPLISVVRRFANVLLLSGVTVTDTGGVESLGALVPSPV
jgi:hypothetical protein